MFYKQLFVLVVVIIVVVVVVVVEGVVRPLASSFRDRLFCSLYLGLGDFSELFKPRGLEFCFTICPRG